LDADEYRRVAIDRWHVNTAELIREKGNLMRKSRRVLMGATSILLVAGLSAAPVAQATSPMKGAPQGTSGTGDGVPGLKAINEPVIITLTHDGASNFIVQPVGRDGEDGLTWVNEIGPYSGTTFQSMGGFISTFDKKNPIVAADVMADGNWTMQIRKLKAAPKKRLKRGSGAGDAVIRFPKPTKGLTRMTLTHNGDSNFIVQPIDRKGDDGISMVNEIGQYKGTVRVPAGTKYLWIIADGEWSYRTK